MKRPLSPSLRRSAPRQQWSKSVQLTQLTVAAALGLDPPRPPRVKLKSIGAAAHSTKPIIVELFCGIGGWSEGARQAGFHTVLAIDSSMELLRVHKLNHPACTQCEMVVGPETEDELLQLIREHVPPGRDFHLHGSPPCQRISSTSAIRNLVNHNVEDGVSLVCWFVAFVRRLRPTTWSMEEVPHQQVTGALTMARCFHPELVDFVSVVRMSDYGVPQHRKRCIAGTPRLIERLRCDPTVRAPAPVLSDLVSPPAGATICMSSTGKYPDYTQNVEQLDGSYTNHTIRRCMRSVHQVAWTCLAGHTLIWCTADYYRVRQFTVREQATVQTFPPEYNCGARSAAATTGIGNAVPPLFARMFMRGV